ncbi:MAG: hypothetical protein RL434_3200 [Pseudomonadota bacterium]|jgi:hypothetical protein
MNTPRKLLLTGGIALAMTGCATYQTAPSVMALPGQGTNFEQFQYDDFQCQTYARNAIGQGTNQQAASESGINSAVVGTVVGAAAGALIGAASGNAGAGAAIGAGSGLIVGGASGTEAYNTTGMRSQDRFDAAYIQCMYAKGHQVPLPGGTQPYTQQRPSAPAAAPAYPPPGTPPPPEYR